jgi:hypothetical protein
MQSKSLMLKSVVASGVLALLGSGAGFAATATDASIVAVTDDEQLNELVDANDGDQGAEHNVDNGAEHDVDNHAMNDLDEDAKNDVQIDGDVKGGAADAIDAQQDVVEATQEHGNESGGTNQPGGDSGPNG